MIEFESKKWYDISDERCIPLTHEELNRIDGGLDKAIKYINKMEPNYVKACDLTKILVEIEPESNIAENWIADEDCWVSVYVSGSRNDDAVASLRVNGIEIFYADMDSSSSSIRNTFLLPPCFFVKQGSTITFKTNGRDQEDHPSYCRVYGCL